MLEHFNVYGKYAGAYKSGGFNTRDSTEEGFSDGFKEEKLNAWELGFKGEALDRRVRLSAAFSTKSSRIISLISRYRAPSPTHGFSILIMAKCPVLKWN